MSKRDVALQAMDDFDIARFWSQVEVGLQSQCWPWRGSVSNSGYGHFKAYGCDLSAHRVAYTIIKGSPPEANQVVRHTCDCPACCNPYHLVAGTHADNVRDRVKRGRSAKGTGNGRSKLTEKAVIHIRESEMTTESLARVYKVSPDTIRAVKRRKLWKHVA